MSRKLWKIWTHSTTLILRSSDILKVVISLFYDNIHPPTKDYSNFFRRLLLLFDEHNHRIPRSGYLPLVIKILILLYHYIYCLNKLALKSFKYLRGTISPLSTYSETIQIFEGDNITLFLIKTSIYLLWDHLNISV
jgi:hypothetical protein